MQDWNDKKKTTLRHCERARDREKGSRKKRTEFKTLDGLGKPFHYEIVALNVSILLRNWKTCLVHVYTVHSSPCRLSRFIFLYFMICPYVSVRLFECVVQKVFPVWVISQKIYIFSVEHLQLVQCVCMGLCSNVFSVVWAHALDTHVEYADCIRLNECGAITFLR